MKVAININGEIKPIKVYNQGASRPIMTLGDAIDIYCTDNPDNLAASTIKKYRHIREGHLDKIMDMDIYQITEDILEKALAEETAKGYAMSTVTGFRRLVRKVSPVI